MDDVLSEGYWRDSPWDCPFGVNPCRQVVRLCIKRLAAGRGYRQSRQGILRQHIQTDSYTGTLYLTAAITDICTHTPLTSFYTGNLYMTAAITDILTHTPLTAFYTSTLYLTAAITDILTHTPLTAFYTSTLYLTGYNKPSPPSIPPACQYSNIARLTQNLHFHYKPHGIQIPLFIMQYIQFIILLFKYNYILYIINIYILLNLTNLQDFPTYTDL